MKRSPGCNASILIALLILSLMVPVALAAEQGNFGRVDPLTTLPELNRSGVSAGNLSVPPEYQSTPAPVTVFKVEVTASSLPGPRDMAYGPSVIGFSVDPVTLAISILVIAIAVVGYYFYSRKNQHKKT